MAATITDISFRLSQGSGETLIVGTLSMSASYPANGEPVAVAGALRLSHLLVQSKGGYVFEWDPANQKLLAKRPGLASTPLVEETAAVNLSVVCANVPFFALAPN